MRPMWCVASSPIFFQLFPPSSDLYVPSPQDELCRLLGSPVPTHTMEGSDGAIAMSPIVDTLSLSNTDSHDVPLFVVFQTPPDAVPTYTMFGLLSTTAKSSMRPPIVAGPISRNSKFLNLSAGFGWSPGPASVFIANEPKKAKQAKIAWRALHLCFISIPLCARPGMLLLPARMTHHMFLKGQTNPVQRQTRDSLVTFHGAGAGTLVRLSAAIPGLRSSTTHPFDRMLGYPTVFIDCMLRAHGHSRARILFTLRLFLLVTALFAAFGGPCAGIVSAQQVRFPARKGGVANLEAKTQSRKGDVTTADGDVDIQYADTRLRADHVEYNGKTYEAVATGHVHLDYNNEHIDADEAHYNVSTGHGLFHNVRGNVKIERRPNPDVLVTDNPLYFEARDVERFAGDVYLIHRAWITICDPEHPKWQFYAPHARIRLDKTAALINANFRLFRVPLIWLPYATAPTGRRVRQSGFLIPDIGQSSRKGFIVGDAFYWAPTPWMDTTFGAQFMSRRGILERGSLRAKPFENTSIQYTFLAYLPPGLRRHLRRSHQLGSAQRRLPHQQFPRLQPQSRGLERQEFSDLAGSGNFNDPGHSGHQRHSPRSAGSAFRFRRTIAVEECASLFLVRQFCWRRPSLRLDGGHANVHASPYAKLRVPHGVCSARHRPGALRSLARCHYLRRFPHDPLRRFAQFRRFGQRRFPPAQYRRVQRRPSPAQSRALLRGESPKKGQASTAVQAHHRTGHYLPLRHRGE